MVQGELLFSMAHGIDFFFYPWTSNWRFFRPPHATVSIINDIPLSMSNMFLSCSKRVFFFLSSTVPLHSKKLRYAASCVWDTQINRMKSANICLNKCINLYTQPLFKKILHARSLTSHLSFWPMVSGTDELVSR